MTMAAWETIQELAIETGFDQIGVAPPDLPEEADRLHQWIDAGHAGSMQWLTRNTDVRLDLRARFPWASSILVVSRSYRRAARSSDGLLPYVSAYAWAEDYHDVLLPGLEQLATRIRDTVSPDLRWHAYVDTGPALERQLAARAGIGWLGKHGLMMNARAGSEFFLGLLVTNLRDLPTQHTRGSCGSCVACQPACPTDAFVSPGVLDARRCISYLTIEHRGPIDRALRPAIGGWLFGCDLCQTACPFNHNKEPAQPWLGSEAGLASVDLEELLRMDDDAFRQRFRRTPLWRPRRVGLLRNALIVAANLRRTDCIDAATLLLRDPDEVLREAASWCVSQLGDPDRAIEQARANETVEWVQRAMDEDLQSLPAH